MVRSELSEEKTLIGFAGAPWTVATYMIAGKGGDDQKSAKVYMTRNPDDFKVMIDKLTVLFRFKKVEDTIDGTINKIEKGFVIPPVKYNKKDN